MFKISLPKISQSADLIPGLFLSEIFTNYCLIFSDISGFMTCCVLNVTNRKSRGH